ncbi:MAG: HD domain-containing protein [Bacteroidetes bacterium]|nr:HD domain-containing protein [Bacteroidota bacterium]
MKRFFDEPNALEKLLQPENPLEERLLTIPEFQYGLLWGEPRYGHPEGRVCLHVREVFDNIDLIEGLSAEDRNRLRLIALSHDTFKYAEDRSRPRDWSKHHSLLARRFMENHLDDPIVLDIIETHDDAYYIWLDARHGPTAPSARRTSLESLLERMNYCLQLYYLFFKCDTQSGDKTQAPLKWFEKTIEGIEVVKIREEGG